MVRIGLGHQAALQSGVEVQLGEYARHMRLDRALGDEQHEIPDADAGSPEAVDHVRALAADFPTRLNLRAALVSARANCLAATWTPVDLDEVIAILAGVAVPSEPTFAESELVKALEAFQDMGSHAFREGIVRDMQRLMDVDRLLPIPDHNLARDHLRAIARYVFGEGGPEARRALLAALEGARPDERALDQLRGLLAAHESRPARDAALEE
ncbi:hypothetical protein ACH47Z_17220 [Streptomyces sp. NPDC020192]|uniref:effector-associated domain 2-containing protein n=1 Tax=Streptomyces sp. NPDC020192 TaxID=3365066 RepID=UPI0037A77139